MGEEVADVVDWTRNAGAAGGLSCTLSMLVLAIGALASRFACLSPLSLCGPGDSCRLVLFDELLVAAAVFNDG